MSTSVDTVGSVPRKLNPNWSFRPIEVVDFTAHESHSPEMGGIWHGFGLCPYTMGLPALSPICNALAPLSSKKPSQDRSVPTHGGPLRRRQSGMGGAVRENLWSLARLHRPSGLEISRLWTLKKQVSLGLKCSDCGRERLLTLSCKQRGICPSCDAKRAAAFAAFLQDELLEKVGHSMWTFTIPKMLRPYFLCRIRHRKYYADSGTMPRRVRLASLSRKRVGLLVINSA